MFSIGKNRILNPFGILRIKQNFWPYENPEYLYRLFDVFAQADNM